MKIFLLRNCSQIIKFSKKESTHPLIPSQEGTFVNPLLRGEDAKHQGCVNATQKLKYLFVILFLLIQLITNAQTPRETRAVWVSTNYRLDWPPPNYNERTQKEALLKILDNIERKNLNTVYFQIRSNGTVLFRSSQELFSPYITGNIGEFGSFDPLEFAIEEAHKRGLEIHAWLNTMRVYSGNNISIKNSPLHISQIHKGWVYKKADGSIWLNPGIPDVRNYLVELINEVVQNYDVDGIQLDFIRYPLTPIEDNESFAIYGNDKSLSDWRRNNITEFISLLNHRIKITNPKIKLGVTPIGIYKSIPNGRGMEGYTDVYQDTREWLRLGIIDYAVPQIYWDARSNPKFDVIAKNWIHNSYGKNIVIGIAAYKPEVYNEIEREINITRKLKTSGVAFFRYKNIKRKHFYSFTEKTLPSAMPWIKSKPQLAELNLTSNFANKKVLLKFNIDKKNLSNNGYFALHESNNSQNSSKLIKVVPNYIHKLNFSLPNPNKINYYYTATQFNQLWNESSNQSNDTKISIPYLIKIEKEIFPFNKPILLQNGTRSSIIIYSNSKEQIKITTSSHSLLSEHTLRKGFNKIKLNYDLNNYKKVSIHFLTTDRKVKLKG